MNHENTRNTVETPTLENFGKWKEFLSSQVYTAESAGASEQSIVDTATRIGNFLATKIDPKNNEERLLKELWDNGSQEERHALASMVVKMVSDGERH